MQADPKVRPEYTHGDLIDGDDRPPRGRGRDAPGHAAGGGDTEHGPARARLRHPARLSAPGRTRWWSPSPAYEAAYQLVHGEPPQPPHPGSRSGPEPATCSPSCCWWRVGLRSGSAATSDQASSVTAGLGRREPLEVRAPAHAHVSATGRSNASSSASRVEPLVGWVASRTQARSPRSRSSRSNTRPAEQARRRARPAGSGTRPCAQPHRDRRAQERDLAREVLRRALARATASRSSAATAAGAAGRRQQRVVGADDQRRVGAAGAEQQRALGVGAGGERAQHRARERVHLAGAVPARHVAARRRARPGVATTASSGLREPAAGAASRAGRP